MLGITIYSISIIAIAVIVCFFIWRDTRSLKDVGICLSIGIGTALMVMFSVFVSWGLILLVVLMLGMFFAIIPINEFANQFVVLFSVMAILLGMGISVQVCSRCEHILLVNYTIELNDNTIDIDYNVEDIPDKAYDEILSKVSQMRKNNEHYYEGVIKIKYSGRYPLYLGNHTEKCSCTDEKVCDMCKGYIECCVIE